MGKYKDLISGVCGMILSAVFFMLSVQIGLKEKDAIGASFLPKIVTVMMFAMFAIVTYRGMKDVKAGKEEKKLDYAPNFKGVALMFIAMLVYAYLLKPVGFIITSILFLMAAICLMTKKEELKPVKYTVIAVIVVIFIYFIFMEVFGIRIPKGIL